MSDDESGMRYRGHHDQHKTQTNDFALSKTTTRSSKARSASQVNHLKTSEPNSPVRQNDDDGDNTKDAPLLNNSFDVSTQRQYDGGAAAAASSSSSSSLQSKQQSGGGVLSTIAAFGRRAKCKVLDKLPISWAAKFATPPPTAARVALIRRFIDTHVQPVASATAEADGLAPRSALHQLMIKTLWERLNDRAPRCVRRRIGEEDETIDATSLRGKIWSLIGFQGVDPSTDLRATGALGLEHLLYFVTKHPRLLQRIAETPPEHAPITANYPFAVASINVSGLLLDMLKAVTKSYDHADGNGDVQAATKNMTGAFHVGTYSAMEARRKLANMLTDPLAVWRPSTGFSSTSDNVPWTAAAFKTHSETAMDQLFGAPVVVAALGGGNDAAAASTSNSSNSNSSGKPQQQKSQEELDMEMIAERLAMVYVATCCILHEQWCASSRSLLKYNEVWKSTAVRLELLLRDSNTFAATMNEIWKDE